MANMSVPVDGRRQFSATEVMLGNYSLGRPLMAGVEPIGGDRYVVSGSWPAPKAATGFSGATVASGMSPAPDRPMTPGRAIWPNLP